MSTDKTVKTCATKISNLPRKYYEAKFSQGYWEVQSKLINVKALAAYCNILGWINFR
jgi:hypothetical protein